MKKKFVLIVRHIRIFGSKGNSTPENTSSAAVMGLLVSFATGPVSGIDVGGPSRTDVNWPPLSKVTTDVSAGSCSEWARLSDSQLDAKQDSPTTDPRSTRRVVRGSRRDDDSSGPMEIQAVVRCLTAFVGLLHKNTTEDDLKELVSAAGLQKPRCYKLKNKDGHEF